MATAEEFEERPGEAVGAYVLHRARIGPEWVDYNGHMNVAYYVLIFDQATDAVLDQLQLGAAYRRSSDCSVFVGEMHVVYLRELLEGDEVTVASRLLQSDAKRLVLFHRMFCARLDGPAAENEVVCVHVDLARRRSAPWPQTAAAAIAHAVAADARLPRPSRAGRAIGLTDRHATDGGFIAL